MALSSSYTITEMLQREEGSRLYRGYRNRDHRSVYIKVLEPGPVFVRAAERLRHELEVGSHTNSAAAVHPLELVTHEGMPALVLEDFGGRPLESLIGQPMELERFLKVAIAITAALNEIHQRGVVHKELTPRNILVHPVTGDVRITNFELATLLPRQHQAARSPRLIEGDLAYMSPEQAGWMNQVLDSRSDLYSLGIIFYRMLTGRLPFEAKDPVEWVHCHISRAPPPLSAIVPDLPEIVSGIVMMLLAKISDDRYQSAAGLRHDLEECLERWQATGRIDPFVLRQQDVSDRLRLPQRLYGRDTEVAELLEAFERLVATGTPELILVSGYAGIGKTAVVNELQRPVVRQRGRFLAGKFDQHKRDIPYWTIALVIGELMKDILSEGEAHVAECQEQLKEALGANIRLAVEVIPQLELIIGPQPAVPELPPLEARQRMQAVLWRLIRVFAQEAHPLVLFLDDLHWADSGSLELLKFVLTHPDTRYLLVIGAYRANEVFPQHPTALALDAIRKAGARVVDITVGPLSLPHLEALVADTVRQHPGESRPLASLILEKTAGNPFFARQFIADLRDEGLITFSPQARAFRWDVGEIQKKGYTDNVIDLMIGKMRRLPDRAQEALKVAASLGNVVRVEALAMAGARSADEMRTDLWHAVREGLLVCSDDAYRFLHDRIQQAAYALIPSDERAAMHLQIGRRLLAHTPPDELEAHLFDIAGQLNLGAALITDPVERDRLAELDLLAGQHICVSGACTPLMSYLSVGIAMLRPDCWQSQYRLTHDLHHARAWCAILSGNLQTAEQPIQELFRHVHGRLELAEVYRLEIELAIAQEDTERSTRSALSCLRLFGLEFERHPSRDEVLRATLELKTELHDRPIESLLEQPPMHDPEMKALTAVLSAALPAAYYTDPLLSDRFTCEIMRISLKYGLTGTSPVGYALFGVLLGKMLGAFQEAYRFGQLALAMTERAGLETEKARVSHAVGIFINHLIEPYQAMPRFFRLTLEEAQKNGDMLYAGVASFQLVAFRLAAGDRLEDVAAEAEKALDLTRRARLDTVHGSIDVMYQMVQRLRGRRPGFQAIEAGENGDVQPTQRASAVRKFYQHLYAVQLHVLAGDATAALAAARAAKQLIATVEGQMETAEYAFYAALALAAHHDSASPEPQREALTMLKSLEAELRGRAQLGPANQRHRHALVAAEVARITGNDLEAMRGYEQAIRWAHEGGFLQNEAISYETAAHFYRSRGYETFATAYLREARARYAGWGAHAKVSQLDRLYPNLIEQSPPASVTTVELPAENLDLLSVLKASQTISRETVLDKLVCTLLQTVLEQSGARKGYLLLARGGELSIEAEAMVEGAHVVVNRLDSIPATGSPLLPESIIQYVWRTMERVILDDASRSPRFAADGYLLRAKPKSVICLPIPRRPEAGGILYLENDLVAGAFTADRLSTLELLTAQAAISLENALLFSRAEDAVRLRDVFVKIASHELNSPLTSLQLQLQSLLLRLRGAAPAGLPSDQLISRVESAEQQTRRIGALVRTLLNVSQLDSGTVRLELAEVDLCELLQEILARFEEDLQRAGSRAVVDTECPAVVYGDRLRLEQVMSNLLSNAIKFGRGQPIDIQLACAPTTIRFSVRDRGIGIAEADLKRVFQKFERAVTQQFAAGLGLGLYITRQLVEVHGGTISVSSEQGKGSTFTVELPALRPC